jgi:phenylpyruvate tautomerase PptA (4-oxalocrotonate tautomerase family)
MEADVAAAAVADMSAVIIHDVEADDVGLPGEFSSQLHQQ